MEMRQALPKSPPPGGQAAPCTVWKTTNRCRKQTRDCAGGILPKFDPECFLSLGGTLESPAVLRKCKYAFLTLPNYSLIAVANALEPLRMANRLVGQDVYEWSVISMD